MTGPHALLAATAALIALVGLIALTVLSTVTALASVLAPGAAPSAQSVPGRGASDIPPAMLVLYQQAAPICPGLDWSILAGIGSVETDHGRSTLLGVHSGENSAGAAGYMQFLAPTFASVTARHPPPPGGAHPPSRYNAHDAVWTAAAYLCDSGAPRDLRRALFTYNRSTTYVDEVLTRAAAYRASTSPPPGPPQPGTAHPGAPRPR